MENSNCDWCNGTGLAWADCGDHAEPQKCDSCGVYESDEQAISDLKADIRLRKKSGIDERLWKMFLYERGEIEAPEAFSNAL